MIPPMFNRATVHYLRHLSILIAGIATWVCCGCDSPETQDINSSDGMRVEHTIGLYIHTGHTPLSRATPPGSYDKGSGFENYIDIAGNDLRIALYDTSDNWITTIGDPAVTPFSETSSSKTYLLEFKVDKDLRQQLGSSFKVLMLANWRGHYPDLANAGSLSELFDKVSTADYWIDYSAGLPSWNLDASDKIAMFGVSQYDGVNLRPDMAAFLGDLHLLRALAKIEVWESAETADHIKSVSLTRHMTKAVPMPKGVTHQDAYVKNNYDNDYVTYPSLPTGSGMSYSCETSDPLPLLRNPADGHYTVYVPEFPNKSRDGNTRAQLKIEFEQYDAGDYYIDFKYYNDAPEPSVPGEYFDILRNYWYQFEVSKLREYLKVEVQVVPYAHVPLKPDFGLSIAKELIPVYDDSGNLICYFNSETGSYIDKDGKTPIKNPFIIENNPTDPATGWDIVRDDNGTFLYFYDKTTGKYYDADKNEIPDPTK